MDARWDLDERHNDGNRIASWLAAPSIVENAKFLPGNGRDQVFVVGNVVPLWKLNTRACFVTVEVWPRNESATVVPTF